MACVNYECLNCGHTEWSSRKSCKECGSDNIRIEFDEEGMHD